MQTTDFTSSSPFNSVTGALSPAFRDAYLQGRLAPPAAAAVEAYLQASTIQTKTALGRYHELAAAAQAEDRSFEAPRWVREQLGFQPTVSGTGSLRRPAVQVALTSLLALSGASVVQWIRNEPLIPAPVVAAVTRAATSAGQATKRLVQEFTVPTAPEPPAPESALAPTAKPVERVLPTSRTAAATPALESRPTASVALPAYSLVGALPTKLPLSGAVPNSLVDSATSSAAAKPVMITGLKPPTPIAAAPAKPVAPALPSTPAGMVRGRIFDSQGRPLAGATVMVQGTRLVVSTDATGTYELSVPTNATLHFGYGGYFDQIMRNPGTGTMNVTLQQDIAAPKR